MILAGAAALLLLAFGIGEDQPRPPEEGTLTVRQQIIIRVGPAGRQRAASPVVWRESRGPRCVPANRIVGAAAVAQDSVDLVFRDNTRIRARLGRRCPALDFYRGFYVSANPDGRICADRDSIRSRTGGQCEIEQFRTLRAARP